jgi:hypothetical protein
MASDEKPEGRYRRAYEEAKAKRKQEKREQESMNQQDAAEREKRKEYAKAVCQEVVFRGLNEFVEDFSEFVEGFGSSRPPQFLTDDDSNPIDPPTATLHFHSGHFRVDVCVNPVADQLEPSLVLRRVSGRHDGRKIYESPRHSVPAKDAYDSIEKWLDEQLHETAIECAKYEEK